MSPCSCVVSRELRAGFSCRGRPFFSPAPSPGMSSPDFDNQTLAVLRGRMVRYLMRSREVRNPLTCSSSVSFSLSSFVFLILFHSLTHSLSLLLFPQITLGRATKDNQIDVDLSLEGPAWKISRKQGTPKKREQKGKATKGVFNNPRRCGFWLIWVLH